MQYVLCITLQIFKLLIGWKLWRVRWNTIIWVLFYFFKSDKNSPQKGRILWKLPKWTEISATTRSTLEIKNQQISLVQSKKAVSYIQNKYLISVQQNFALLWIQHLEKQLWQQAKAGSLRGKYFRINRRTPRLRVSFNCSYKLKV